MSLRLEEIVVDCRDPASLARWWQTATGWHILKSARAKAIRFTTLDAICRVLDCQPGDILEWVLDGSDVQ
jgi:hypothetical protein